MIRMVERRVRERAQQLYEERGQKEGRALQDWFQAESEILENKALAPLYKRSKGTSQTPSPASSELDLPIDLSSRDTEICESPA